LWGKNGKEKRKRLFLKGSPPGTPEIAPLPMRKKIITQLPPPPIGGFKAEPGIIDNVYVDILKIFRHEGRTWESTPKTYFVHPAEELRDMLLAHLNGHYEGVATGETFRMSGKTDIRIEDNSRAAFITECKIWEGSGNTFLCDQQPPSLIGQLLHEN